MSFANDVTPGDVARISRSAYDVVVKSIGGGLKGDWLVMAPDNSLGAKKMAALRFAQLVTRHLNNGRPIPVIQHTLPRSQYVSWLMVRPFGIAYDSARTLKEPLVGEGNHPSQSMQITRAILHELGHVFATPNLFSPKRRRLAAKGTVFTPPCTPEEEAKAWLWSEFVWAIQFAFHAWNQRSGGSFDNTMGATR